MIIEEIVSEGRLYGTPLLYHATGVHEALDILHTGSIEPRTTSIINGRTVQGVSLTRSFWFASMFNGVIFGLNWNTIRDQYRGRINPTAYRNIGDIAVDQDLPSVGDYRREAEEFVLGPV